MSVAERSDFLFLSVAYEAVATAEHCSDSEGTAADSSSESGDAGRSLAFLCARRYWAKLWSFHYQGGKGLKSRCCRTETRRSGEALSVLSIANDTFRFYLESNVQYITNFMCTVFSMLHREGALWNDGSVCLSVCLSLCLHLTPEWKGLGSPKLARWKPITRVTRELV